MTEIMRARGMEGEWKEWKESGRRVEGEWKESGRRVEGEWKGSGRESRMRVEGEIYKYQLKCIHIRWINTIIGINFDSRREW
jgi:hypothetical protein